MRVLVALCALLAAAHGARWNVTDGKDEAVRWPKGGKTSEVGSYVVGVGIGDVTGPAADVTLMGYASLEQIVDGIHMRLRARAYIFADVLDPRERIVYVIADICMAGQLMKQLIVEELARRIPNSPYRVENFVMQGTHTHSNPGGFLDTFMYLFTNFGYWPDSMQAIVDGTVRAIVNAHNSMVPGRVLMNTGLLRDSSRNRSPTSYLRNPAEERARYNSDIDEDFVLLRIEAEDGRELGALSWFAVHTTSVNGSNHYIDGDNKGAASLMFETWKNPQDFPGKGAFVAGFAQANHGDTSPNLFGAFCQDTGLPCDLFNSTCPTPDGPRSQRCVATGFRANARR